MLSRPAIRFVNAFLIAVAVILSIRDVAAAKGAPRQRTVAQQQFSAKDLQRLLGPKRRLRDFALFTTERGEPAALLLYVTDAHRRSLIEECLAEGVCLDTSADQGLVWLDGEYSLALVISGKLVNSVALGIGSLPLLKPRDHWPYWGPDRRRRPRSDELEPVKLIQLADYNGDDEDWEFRFVARESFSRVSTMLAGYSARQRKVILYPIVSRTTRKFWHDYLFPDAAAVRFHGGKVRYHDFCGHMFNDTQVTEEFTYDREQEAWVRTRYETRDCGAVDGLTRSPDADAFIWFDHSEQAKTAGSLTTLDVFVKAKSGNAGFIMLDIMLDPQLSVPPSADGHPSCRTMSNESDATFWFDPPRCVSQEEGSTCQPATEIGASIPVSLAANADTILYRCEVRIDSKALSGWYPVWATKVRVYGADGHALSVDGVNDLTDFINVEGGPIY